ncbi:MAG: HDIG domain-containing metalloprotein [Dehalococcoidia bacterium]
MLDRGKPRPISIATSIAFGVALAALLIIALFPVFPQQSDVRPGDTARRTLRSPKDVQFESAVRTKERREEAAAAVPEVRLFDPGVQSAQLNAFDQNAAKATQVREQDTETARKRDALADLQLSPRSAETALSLDEERWQAVVAEGRRVLAEKLDESLDESSAAAAKDEIDAQIASDFTADEALLTAELARPLILPTLSVDQALTEDARASASASIAPALVDIKKNDEIVAAGQSVDQVDIEELEATGLLSRRVEWRNVIAVALLSVVAAAALAGYLYLLRPGGVTSERHLIALALVTAIPLLVAKFYLPLVLPDDERTYLAFILPVAAAPILIAALLDTDVAVVTSLLIGTLIAFVSAFLPDVSLVASVDAVDSMRLLLVYALGPIAGIYLVHRADRLNRYFTAGLAVAAVSYALLVATWFIDGDRTHGDLVWMALASGVGGVGSGVLAAGAFVTVGVMFGVTTRVQLMELSQLNAPLLRRLQDEAPGTFHHSIIVGNLAERAADLIGADPLLTRVGCYYHDVGKVLQPGMYIENQLGGQSPHEEMAPLDSATIIRQHVSGGLDLARRERLPARVQAFIPEHHGTRLVAYFYRKAAEHDPHTDPEPYQYPGPKPQTKETAIVMLADSTEAVVRSSPDRSPERIDHLVEEVISERVSEGQLDESDLTLRDLRTIADSFKATMRAVYHPRVQYPQPTPLEARRRVLRLPLMTPPAAGGQADAPRRRRRRFDDPA